MNSRFHLKLSALALLIALGNIATSQSADKTVLALRSSHSLQTGTALPWLLTASVTVVDPYDGKERTGTVKEVWLNRGKYLRSFSLGDYETTLYVQNDEVRYLGSSEAYPGALEYALGKLLQPTDVVDDSTRAEHVSQKMGRTELDCLDTQIGGEHVYFCAAKGEKPLRLLQQEDITVVFNHPVLFQDQDVAKDVTLSFAGHVFARLHVDELRKLNATEIAAQAAFPANASLYGYDSLPGVTHQRSTSPRPLGHFHMANHDDWPVATLVQLTVDIYGKPKTELLATGDNAMRPADIQRAFPEFLPATRAGKPIASIGFITTSGPMDENGNRLRR